MEVRKPVWTSSSFVLYAGGFTVLGAAVAALSYLSNHYGDGAFAAWTLLPLAVLYAIAHAFRARGEWLTAGLFIVAAMVMWAVFVGALEQWWGWLNDTGSQGPFDGWNWGIWILALLVIAAAYADLRMFRFPLLVIFPAVAWYYLIVDFLSGGGNWSAVLTLLVGLLYLGIGSSLDRGPRRPYGFWIQLVAGLLVGGALLYWWHSSEADWAFIATTGVVFVGVAGATGRSSWAVFGIAGLFASAAHWVSEWTNTASFALAQQPSRDWVPPVAFAVVGFFFVLLGLALERRRRLT